MLVRSNQLNRPLLFLILAHFIVFYMSMLFRLSHLMRPREMRQLLHSNQLASVNKQLLHGQTSLLSQPQNAKLNWAQIKKYLNKSESILPQTLGHHQPAPKPMPSPSCLFFLFCFLKIRIVMLEQQLLPPQTLGPSSTHS